MPIAPRGKRRRRLSVRGSCRGFGNSAFRRSCFSSRTPRRSTIVGRNWRRQRGRPNDKHIRLVAGRSCWSLVDKTKTLGTPQCERTVPRVFDFPPATSLPCYLAEESLRLRLFFLRLRFTRGVLQPIGAVVPIEASIALRLSYRAIHVRDALLELADPLAHRLCDLRNALGAIHE